MKTFGKYFAFIVIVIAGTWLFPQQARAQNDDYNQDDNSGQNYIPQQNEPVSLQVFYDELSPYGTWINDPNYGYVWAPNVDQNFRPYVTNGHWVNTDYGWTWVSDFSWGWAPFHYGRWTFNPQYGNIWIPDTVWGPAWVSWRQANGYIGWTPLGPGIDINFSLGSSYNVPYNRWNFVPCNNFMQNDLYRYRINSALCFNIFNLSFVVRNTRYDNDRHFTYLYGPRREDVQRYSGRMIYPVHVRDYDRPGQVYNREYLSIYRPQMRRGSVYGQTPEPRNLRYSEGRNNDNNRNRVVTGPERNSNYQGRNTQIFQQPNRSQGEQQTSRYGNTNYQSRNIQPSQRPDVNASSSQRDQQTSRYGNTNYQSRNEQPAQQDYSSPSRSQGRQQPSRLDNPNYQTRSAQPVQQQAVYQQRNQREERAVQNVQSNSRQQESRVSSNASPQRSQPSVSQGQERPTMVVNPGRDKKEESRGR